MKTFIFIFLTLFISACEEPKQATVIEQVVEEIRQDAIAEVNGEVILKPELEQMAVNMFGEYQASIMDEASRQKLLESMVSTLALAQVSLNQLSEEQRSIIENKTKRYRENLLVSEYVRANATPEPVTESMIAEYYSKNLSQYGQENVRKYQLITSQQALAVDQRNAFLKLFAEIKSEPSLAAMNRKFITSGFQTTYQSGLTGAGLQAQKLLQVINTQTPGKLSEIHYIDGTPFIVMVDEIIQKKAKPLSQVRNSIRKTLAMSQLREAVKTLSESVRQQASVTIHEQQGN